MTPWQTTLPTVFYLKKVPEPNLQDAQQRGLLLRF